MQIYIAYVLYALNTTEFHFLYASCVDFKIETFLSSFCSFTLFHLFYFLPQFSFVVYVYLFCGYDRLTQLAEYLLKRHMVDTYIRVVISIKLYNYIMFKYIYICIYIVSYMYMLCMYINLLQILNFFLRVGVLLLLTSLRSFHFYVYKKYIKGGGVVSKDRIGIGQKTKIAATITASSPFSLSLSLSLFLHYTLYNRYKRLHCWYTSCAHQTSYNLSTPSANYEEYYNKNLICE